jgi:hypothetical protein
MGASQSSYEKATSGLRKLDSDIRGSTYFYSKFRNKIYVWNQSELKSASDYEDKRIRKINNLPEKFVISKLLLWSNKHDKLVDLNKDYDDAYNHIVIKNRKH